jgi:multicomponent Na+:H+ antiporter subunit A
MKEHPAHNKSGVYWPGRLTALLPFTLFIWCVFQVPIIQIAGPMAISFDWVPSLNVRLDFVLDGLSLLFVLIITGIGFLVTIYADAYLAGHQQINRFFFYLHSFLLSMLGLVLSNNLILLFVFWGVDDPFLLSADRLSE